MNVLATRLLPSSEIKNRAALSRRTGNTLQTVGRETTPYDDSNVRRCCLKNVKVCYGASKYLSHARVARTYRAVIRNQCEVVKDIDNADIVILHFEPNGFTALFEAYPALEKKYLVGYFVWEASELPAVYQEAVSHVQEIWTCSRYCCEIFARYHPQVKYVPHIIERDIACSEDDREYVRRIISYDPENIYFLTVTKLLDLRKNTKALAAAFQRVRSAMPRTRLIIKAASRDTAEGLTEDGFIVLPKHLSEPHMNALYQTADAYVSPHHSEGWGLTLSDAILFQKPTIATGYSGNCEFMNAENSLLLDFTIDYIKPADCFYLFDHNMMWAYPSEEDLEQKLLFFYRMRGSPEIRRKTQAALYEIKKFDRDSVSTIIRQRITEIVNSERFSQTVEKGIR